MGAMTDDRFQEAGEEEGGGRTEELGKRESGRMKVLCSIFFS